MDQQQPIYVYIHGLPGSKLEISPVTDAKIIYTSPFDVSAFEKILNPNEKYKLIGFSLGCMAAIEIAAKYSEYIQSLDLISPAAPLELGDFLDDMDGRFVFKTAQSSNVLFWLLSLSQNIMARFTPHFLMHKMFGESCEAELELLKDPQFVSVFKVGLKQSLIHKSAEYRHTIIKYTLPWHSLVLQVKCPVKIWHGTKDTWTPFAMGEALNDTLASKSELVALDDLGHYSALHKALPIILQQASSG